jgi:hypothetical protein
MAAGRRFRAAVSSPRAVTLRDNMFELRDGVFALLKNPTLLTEIMAGRRTRFEALHEPPLIALHSPTRSSAPRNTIGSISNPLLGTCGVYRFAGANIRVRRESHPPECPVGRVSVHAKPA